MILVSRSHSTRHTTLKCQFIVNCCRTRAGMARMQSKAAMLEVTIEHGGAPPWRHAGACAPFSAVSIPAGAGLSLRTAAGRILMGFVTSGALACRHDHRVLERHLRNGSRQSTVLHAGGCCISECINIFQFTLSWDGKKWSGTGRSRQQRVTQSRVSLILWVLMPSTKLCHRTLQQSHCSHFPNSNKLEGPRGRVKQYML